MKIRAGYELTYECPNPVAMLLMVSVHRSRMPDLLTSGEIIFTGGAVPRTYDDRLRQSVHTHPGAAPGG